MALVIDEFGSVSGLITIEDVIEQIVGEIADEFDNINLGKDNITPVDNERWRVKAETYLDQFNEFFNVHLEDQYCETVGGLVTNVWSTFRIAARVWKSTGSVSKFSRPMTVRLICSWLNVWCLRPALRKKTRNRTRRLHDLY